VEAFTRIVEREGEGFVKNSARTVAAAYAESMWGVDGLSTELLGQIHTAHRPPMPRVYLSEVSS